MDVSRMQKDVLVERSVMEFLEILICAMNVNNSSSNCSLCIVRLCTTFKGICRAYPEIWYLSTSPSAVTTYQHCCPKIKFMEKLSNKNVDFQHISNIFLLNIPQNFNKPLKVAM
jgi:hypothetical protein